MTAHCLPYLYLLQTVQNSLPAFYFATCRTVIYILVFLATEDEVYIFKKKSRLKSKRTAETYIVILKCVPHKYMMRIDIPLHCKKLLWYFSSNSVDHQDLNRFLSFIMIIIFLLLLYFLCNHKFVNNIEKIGK